MMASSAQIKVTPKFHVLTWKQFHNVFIVFRTKKDKNEGEFKISWWVHQRGRCIQMEQALLKAQTVLAYDW